MGFIYKNAFDTGRFVVHVERSVVQSIPSGAATKVEYDTAIYDPLSLYDFGNDNIVIPKTGTWLFNVASSFAYSPTGYRQVRLHKSGTTLLSLNSWATLATAGEEVYGSTVHVGRFTAGAVVSGHVFQNTGFGLNVSIGTPRDILQGVLLHV